MKEVEKSQESDGGDFEPTPDIVWHQSQSDKLQRVEFEAPEAGEYRLFVYLDDGFGIGYRKYAYFSRILTDCLK